MSNESLWPQNLMDKGNSTPPRKILLDQAEALKDITNYDVTGEVTTSEGTHANTKTHVFVHQFRVVANYVDNYRMTIFRVMHGFKHYPLSIYEVFSEEKYEDISNEKEFKKILEQIFASEEVTNLIQSLLAKNESDLF